MADHYVKTIAAALAEMHPELSSQAFIDRWAGQELTLKDRVTTFTWNWQSFFEALAWQGLEETGEFDKKIGNDSIKKEIYGYYNTTASGEISVSKCN
ncbi:hypothetical protein [Cesiribacter andamanensis]|uniref:hypothetical protein n=1 Tax=Cesiribacter andamanensis TaxID=649507 RepID=UPI00058E9A69|nr:hypothetical protein [Cesiribacter andamanensis]